MQAQDISLPWEQPGWFQEASAWIHTALERQALVATGEIEVLHRRAWSAFARVPTTAGLVYFKAASPMLRFEAALTQALARWRPDCTVPVLAVDVERGWLLSADAGVTLRSLMQSPADLWRWHELLPLYAQVQIDLTPRVPELLALGTPDRRLAGLPALFEQLLEDKEGLRVGLPKGLTPEEYEHLRDLHPRFAALCEQLAGYGIPETLVHEEAHDANILVGQGSYIFTDWSDSSVAHPFFGMVVALSNTSDRLNLDEYGPEMMRLRDLYLEPWTRFAAREQLVAAFRLGYRLGMVNRALTWHADIAALPIEHKESHLHAVAAWLQYFLEAEETNDE
jgi:hypothetical protein